MAGHGETSIFKWGLNEEKAQAGNTVTGPILYLWGKIAQPGIMCYLRGICKIVYISGYTRLVEKGEFWPRLGTNWAQESIQTRVLP